jgi:hypothetical protein
LNDQRLWLPRPPNIKGSGICARASQSYFFLRAFFAFFAFAFLAIVFPLGCEAPEGIRAPQTRQLGADSQSDVPPRCHFAQQKWSLVHRLTRRHSLGRPVVALPAGRIYEFAIRRHPRETEAMPSVSKPLLTPPARAACKRTGG